MIDTAQKMFWCDGVIICQMTTLKLHPICPLIFQVISLSKKVSYKVRKVRCFGKVTYKRRHISINKSLNMNLSIKMLLADFGTCVFEHHKI